jgi:hypothetical protein
MGGRILVSPVLQELEKLLRAALFKETHQRAFDCLYLCAGDFGYLAVAIDEAARDLFELEVASNIGMHENLCEFSGCDDELWDEIDGVISITTKFSGGCLISAELSIELSRDVGTKTIGAYHVGHRPG